MDASSHSVKLDQTPRSLAILIRLTQVGTGVLFLATSVHKGIDPRDFLRAIYGYSLVGPPVAKFIASAFIGAEFWVGLSLTCGLFRRPAVLAAQVLFVVFILAQLSVIVRGLSADCGCGISSSEPVGWASVLRTTSLLAVVSAGSIWNFWFRRGSRSTGGVPQPI